MLGKLLNDFKEKMITEDTSDNTIKNYVSDIKIFCNWYQEIGFLENIDKIDGGTVTVLNNFLQDLKKGTISINSQQYSMPENGMILLVARE